MLLFNAAMNLLVFYMMFENLRSWSGTLYRTIMWMNLIMVFVCLVLYFM